MRVSAKADYAVRAAIELAASADAEHPLKGEAIGAAQGIPLPFLQNILAELRHAGIVHSITPAKLSANSRLTPPVTEPSSTLPHLLRSG